LDFKTSYLNYKTPKIFRANILLSTSYKSVIKEHKKKPFKKSIKNMKKIACFATPKLIFIIFCFLTVKKVIKKRR
jgi:hypothetical protein